MLWSFLFLWHQLWLGLGSSALATCGSRAEFEWKGTETVSATLFLGLNTTRKRNWKKEFIWCYGSKRVNIDSGKEEMSQYKIRKLIKCHIAPLGNRLITFYSHIEHKERGSPWPLRSFLQESYNSKMVYNLLQRTTKWGLSIQKHKPMGENSHLNYLIPFSDSMGSWPSHDIKYF